jgi:cytochrome c oxidase subunit II
VIAASKNAVETDYLLTAFVLASAAVLVLVFGLMLFFGWRYRASNPMHRGAVSERTWKVEITWTAATLVAFFGMDVWAADLYLRDLQPPAHALKIYVIAKQWMWKTEHPGGQREINALHVPIDRDIQLIMTSEDVIHDFSVPAFRLKRDVLPGRYETTWFHPIKVGTFRLYCDQYCGTDHSAMVGEVTVMTKDGYQRWLGRNGQNNTLVDAGHALFIRYGCSGCHVSTEGGGGGTVRAPPLMGVYGHPVPLSDRTVVLADDKYIRDSILQPDRQIVASYQNLMPSFAGQISEEDLVRIIAYIKSIGEGPPVGTQTDEQHPLTGSPPYATMPPGGAR